MSVCALARSDRCEIRQPASHLASFSILIKALSVLKASELSRLSIIRQHEPGQYVYINIPAISVLEWHPFTLSSAPADAAGSSSVGASTLHIKGMGAGTFTQR